MLFLQTPVPANYSTYLIFVIGSFMLGACIGSFLNVVIYRTPLGISLSDPARSFCPSCKYQIPMHHNIPLVSWLLLRGKCANCGTKIPMRYWLVEMLTACLFLLTFYLCWTQGYPWRVFPYWIMISIFIAGSFIDLEHYILPDSLTLGGLACGLIASVAVPEFIVAGPGATRWVNFLHSLGGAVLGLGAVWLVVEVGKLIFGKKRLEFETPATWSLGQPSPEEEPVFTLDGEPTPWSEMFARKSDKLILHCPDAEIDGKAHGECTLTIHEKGVTVLPAGGGKTQELPLEQVHQLAGTCDSVIIPREAMGLGDVKFMGMVGAFLGWKGVLFTVFAGSILGTLCALALILTGRREWAQRVPFGPYLAAGATVYLFFGPQLIQWYLGWSLGKGTAE